MLFIRSGFHGVKGTHSDTATPLIDKELEIEQGTATPGESGKNVLPTSLLLVYSRQR